jgi:hypothetical protein
MKNSFEIFGGFISSLLIFKGLTLLSTAVVQLFFSSATSITHLLLDFVFFAAILLPLIIFLLIIVTFVLTFSLAYPKHNNYKLWIGFGFAFIVGYANKAFFLGRLNPSQLWIDLLIGATLIVAAILIGRILSSKFSDGDQE